MPPGYTLYDWQVAEDAAVRAAQTVLAAAETLKRLDVELPTDATDAQRTAHEEGLAAARERLAAAMQAEQEARDHANLIMNQLRQGQGN